MNEISIKAAGYLLSTYHSDLVYFKKFQEFITNRISKQEYLTKGEGCFQSFINEYRVARNVKASKIGDLLNTFTEFRFSPQPEDVQKLAEEFKRLDYTWNKLAVSLASKLLFLANPSYFLPIDSRVRNALSMKQNDYPAYFEKVHTFWENESSSYMDVISKLEAELEFIECDFPGLYDLPQIRLYRYIDKILWVRGG